MMIFTKIINYVLCLSAIFLLLPFTTYANKMHAKTTQYTNVYIEDALKKELVIPKIGTQNVFQLFTHGKPGELLINGQWKNAQQIADFLKPKIQHSTFKIQHLNIYGCEFAKGEKGLQAVAYLEKNLHVAVSASNNITGKDGDWVLEVGKPIANISVPSYQENLQYGAGSCMGAQTVTMAFTGTPTITGTANTVGSTYRYSNVLQGTGVTQQVDAVFTLNSLNFGSSTIQQSVNFQYDVPSSTIGIDNNFQPSFVGSTLSPYPALGTYILSQQWTVSFYLTGTSTPVNLPVIVEVFDNDGTISSYYINEIVSFDTPPSSIATSSNGATPTTETVTGNTVTSNNSTQAGIGTGLQYMVYANYPSISSFQMTIKDSIQFTNPSTTWGSRYHSFVIGCQNPGATNFPAPVVIVPTYDSGTVTSALGGTAISNVASNDSINGIPAVLGVGGNATVSEVGTWPTGISLNTTTGAIDVLPGTAPGTYPVTYQLCDLSIPANCVTQIDTVFVTGCTTLNLAADCDGDGVSNGQEAIDGTNPNDACSFNILGQFMTPDSTWNTLDCDGDGITNATEKANGTNPLDICSPGITSAPTIAGGTTYTGTKTYVPSVIDVSTLTNNGGIFTITYNASSVTTGVDPTTVGSSYPASFSQQFRLTDVIPTDAVTTPSDLVYSNFSTSNGSTIGGLVRKQLQIKVDPLSQTGGNIVLNKNTGWVNTGLPNSTSSANETALKAIYNNSITGTLGVGPLTVPAYTANTNTTTPLNGNLVSIAQYGVSSGIQTSLPSYFTNTTINSRWRQFNTGSSAGSDASSNWNVLAKDYSFDGVIQSATQNHKDYELSSAELMFAYTTPRTSIDGFGITNKLEPYDQTVAFSKTVLNITPNCPNLTNLNLLVSSTTPTGDSLVWFTNVDHSGTAYATPTAATTGTYYAFYYNPTTGCYSPASTEVNIDTCVINIVPTYDSGTVTSALGGTAISNVASNDSINGAPAVLGVGGNATVSEVGTWPTGISLNTTTGAVDVLPGTPPGAYPVTYQLCDTMMPANCMTQVDTVFVTPSIDPDPEIGTVTSALGGTAIINVASNDSINGAPAVLGVGGNATVSEIGTWPTGISLNTTTGAIDVLPGTPPGTYPVTYQLCDTMMPANCMTQVDTVYVTPSIVPAYDSGIVTSALGGTAISNVASNDSVNGTPAVLGVNATVSEVGTWPTGISLNTTTGAVDVLPGTPPGAYPVTYQLCDTMTPANCMTQVDTVYVTPSVVTDPDINVTYVGVPVPGNVSTNDDVPTGTIYGSPIPQPGNPDSSLPVIGTDGTYTFTSPVPGVFNFLVPVCPPGQTTNCPLELLTITVLDANSTTNPPVANTDIASTLPSTPVTLNTLANDLAGNSGNTLVPSTVTVIDSPRNGTITVNPTTGEITYTPNSGFTGVDTLYYQVCDDQIPAQCATAMQIIDVLPSTLSNITEASDDYNSTTAGVNATGNALNNDTDPNGNEQTVTPAVTTTAQGTFTIDSTGAYTYEPAPGFTGPVSYTYTLCDNGTPQACTEATVYITVRTSTPLPIVLLQFTGNVINGSNSLVWKTQGEINNSYFNVYHSTDGVNYKLLTTTPSKAIGGNSETTLNYSYLHTNPVTALNYYKLSSIDIDGKQYYYNVVLLNNTSNTSSEIVIYPNPFTTNLTVYYPSEIKGVVTVKITDAIGNSINQELKEVSTGSNTIQLTQLSKLAAGVYYLTIVDEENGVHYIQKIIKSTE